MATAKMADNTERASSSLVAALGRSWARVRALHPEVPEVVLIVASGAGAKGGTERWRHFPPCRWEHHDQERHEVMIRRESLRRGPKGVMGTLLHEAAHGLAAARGIQDISRQGRYHNRRFRELAEELGLRVSEHRPYGWAQTELGDQARKGYAAQLRDLERALVLFALDELARGSRRKGTSRLRLWTCGCEPPRKIRIAAATAELGPIFCGICDQEFEQEDDEQEDDEQEDDG